MYIVVNISKNILAITDMKIEIPPNQSRDLHKIPTLIPPEKSKDLRTALSMGHLKEVRRDPPPKQEPDRIIHETKIIKEETDKNEIVEALFERLKKEIPSLTEQSKSPSDELLIKMIRKMEKMDKTLKSKQFNGAQIEDEDIEIDPNLLQQIHARAVEKLTKNSGGDISYDQKEEKDKSLSDGVDELEELMG